MGRRRTFRSLRTYEPDRTTIAIVDISQDDPLWDYGFSSQQVGGILSLIVNTFHFNG